jgi:hypothetical protein
MRSRAALVYLSLSIALASAHTTASATVSTSASDKRSSELAKEASQATPAALLAAHSSVTRQLFPVQDEKGLLLTCVAPEIETNKDTDVFRNCNLAPGRTLDDVMHSFIGAMHEEQRKQAREHAETNKDSDGESAAKAAQK